MFAHERATKEGPKQKYKILCHEDEVIVLFLIACKADQSYMLGLNEASYDYSMMLFFKSACRVNGSGLSCQET